MDKKIWKKLKRKKKRNDFARITRKYGGKHTKRIARGIIHDISINLVQLCLIEDFKFVETIVFPTQHISKVRFNKNDKYYNKIIHLENITKKLKIASKPKLSNWSSFFKSLETDCVIVETEDSKNRTFHIGGVIEVKNKQLKFLYFNAQGKIDKKPYWIKFKDITKVTLDSNYSEVFKKHVRN